MKIKMKIDARFAFNTVTFRQNCLFRFRRAMAASGTVYYIIHQMEEDNRRIPHVLNSGNTSIPSVFVYRVCIYRVPWEDHHLLLLKHPRSYEYMCSNKNPNNEQRRFFCIPFLSPSLVTMYNVKALLYAA